MNGLRKTGNTDNKAYIATDSKGHKTYWKSKSEYDYWCAIFDKTYHELYDQGVKIVAKDKDGNLVKEETSLR